MSRLHAARASTSHIAARFDAEAVPVLIERGEYDCWLHGSIEDVIRFQFRESFVADRMTVERSEDLWNSGAPPPAAGRQLELL